MGINTSFSRRQTTARSAARPVEHCCGDPLPRDHDIDGVGETGWSKVSRWGAWKVEGCAQNGFQAVARPPRPRRVDTV
jgi:hypothetical protein